MGKRNAHAVAARARKAGPHSRVGRPIGVTRERVNLLIQEQQLEEGACAECGKDLGYGCPTNMCWPCERELDTADLADGE